MSGQVPWLWQETAQNCPGRETAAWLSSRQPWETIRRKVFVSYHHDSDQWYYDEFSRLFSESYEVVRDNSLDRRIDSDDPEYVMRRIRENYITGTSCTLVLCGAETPGRKYVDWEIKATLDKEHGLIGINLPTIPRTADGTSLIPERLRDNLLTGYAVSIDWINLRTDSLQRLIETANSKMSWLRSNSRPLRPRNAGEWMTWLT